MATFELLREMFHYEPVSGHLIWKVGKRAGSQRGKGGYRHVRVGDKYMYEHRIAMLLTLGEIPEDIQIDHVNHDKGGITGWQILDSLPTRRTAGT